MIGSFQLGALLGSTLDRFFDGTVTPLSVGFVLPGTATALAVRTARRPA